MSARENLQPIRQFKCYSQGTGISRHPSSKGSELKPLVQSRELSSGTPFRCLLDGLLARQPYVALVCYYIELTKTLQSIRLHHFDVALNTPSQSLGSLTFFISAQRSIHSS